MASTRAGEEGLRWVPSGQGLRKSSKLRGWPLLTRTPSQALTPLGLQRLFHTQKEKVGSLILESPRARLHFWPTGLGERGVHCKSLQVRSRGLAWPRQPCLPPQESPECKGQETPGREGQERVWAWEGGSAQWDQSVQEAETGGFREAP